MNLNLFLVKKKRKERKIRFIVLLKTLDLVLKCFAFCCVKDQKIKNESSNTFSLLSLEALGFSALSNLEYLEFLFKLEWSLQALLQKQVIQVCILTRDSKEPFSQCA